jgi:hypothetical protein
MKNRISRKLTWLKDELRRRAIKEEDDEKRDDLWRLYYAAKDAETEVRELIKDAETRNVLEVVANYGLLEVLMEEERNNPTTDDDEFVLSDHPRTDSEHEIPPRQMRLWD